MRLLGFEITRTKATRSTLQSVPSSRGGWYPIIRESFPGAWQTNTDVRLDNVLTYAAVYACVTLIASDIGKLRIRLVENDGDGIWTEVENPAYSPVLRKPNHFQSRIQFLEQWITAKLEYGNTYVLKQRDQRGVVTDLYVLDSGRVQPLVAPNGEVFYSVSADTLSELPDGDPAIPASEIIHDRMNCLWHPLCGVSPITACGVSAIQGLRIQDNSAIFFGNGSNPGGVLTAPGHINQDTADRLKDYWSDNFTGSNVGKVAVLGDGLKFEQMTMTAVDAQLIEQLKWTAENVCIAFHVPPYKINVGPPPNYNNIEALDQQYYSQCLQTHIESIEVLLDEGLALADRSPQVLGTEFDLDDLIRMDTPTRVKAAADSIGSGAVSPNEARKKFFGLGPVTGGNTPYMQQQNYSLEALSARDEKQIEDATNPPPIPPQLAAQAANPPQLPASTSADQPPDDIPAKVLDDWRVKTGALLHAYDVA